MESVDIYPTLCALASLPAPDGLDGQSIAETLRDPAAKSKDFILHVYPRNDMLGRAVRTGRHRLVEWKKIGAPRDTATLELYDYETDPKETKSLAADHPEIVSQLRAILDQQPEPKAQIKTTAAPSPSPKKKKKGGNQGKAKAPSAPAK